MLKFNLLYIFVLICVFCASFASEHSAAFIDESIYPDFYCCQNFTTGQKRPRYQEPPHHTLPQKLQKTHDDDAAVTHEHFPDNDWEIDVLLESLRSSDNQPPITSSFAQYERGTTPPEGSNTPAPYEFPLISPPPALNPQWLDPHLPILPSATSAPLVWQETPLPALNPQLPDPHLSTLPSATSAIPAWQEMPLTRLRKKQSPAITPCNYRKLRQAIEAPQSIPKIITELHLEICQFPPQSTCLHKTLQCAYDNISLEQQEARRRIVLSLAELCVLLSSRPNLNLDLVREVEDHYSLNPKIGKNHEAKTQIQNLRSYVKLTYALQQITNRFPAYSPETALETLKRFKLDLNSPQKALSQAAEYFTHSMSQATQICKEYVRFDKVIRLLRFIESTRVEDESTQNTLISDLLCLDGLSSDQNSSPTTPNDESDSPYLDQNVSEPLEQEVTSQSNTQESKYIPDSIHPSFFTSIMEEITVNPSKMQSSVAKVFYEVHKHESESTQVSSLLQAVKEQLNDSVHFSRELCGIYGIMELCIFILSPLSFDAELFQSIKEQYPTQINEKNLRQGPYIKALRHLRVIMKITFALQNLRENVTLTDPTRIDWIKHFEVDQEDAKQALHSLTLLYRGYKSHKSLVHPLKICDALNICTVSGTRASILQRQLEKAEKTQNQPDLLQ